MAQKKEPIINEDMKRFIILLYAGFRRTTEVVKQVEKEFGKKVDADLIRDFDLSKKRNQNRVGKCWHELFVTARDEFIEGVVRHPIAHKAYRIEQLGEMADEAKTRGNYKLAAELYEQAAKELGGAYTNELKVRGQVRHDVNGSVQHRHVTSIEEQRNILSDRIGEALRRLPAPKPN